MANRKTVYNNITSPEKLAQVNSENIDLMNDFLEYLRSVDKAASTIKQYEANLKVFLCWNLEYNKNKFFIDLTKREIAKFQSHALNEWGWSPKRLRTVKATISSLSNFIENVLDDEYEDYRPIVRKIESPENVAVRDKSVFKEEELQQLLDYLVGQGDWQSIEKACILALAMYSGRRKAELPRFKVSYFDDSNLICGGSLYKTPEKVVTKGRGSRGKLLDLYTLAKPFDPYLKLWLDKRNELGIESEWLFPKIDREGKCVDEKVETNTIDSWGDTFNTILSKKLGIETKFYWHSMRHYFVTALARNNIPDDVINEIIGWSKNGGSAMVSVYKDIDTSEKLEQYFGEEGIKKVEQKGLNDL